MMSRQPVGEFHFALLAFRRAIPLTSREFLRLYIDLGETLTVLVGHNEGRPPRQRFSFAKQTAEAGVGFYYYVIDRPCRHVQNLLSKKQPFAEGSRVYANERLSASFTTGSDDSAVY